MSAGNKSSPYILADGRWSGAHGIGRFSSEVLARLNNSDILAQGPKPLSLQNIFWQTYQLHQKKKYYRVFFTPGFNPPLYSSIPFVLTIHDLIHLYLPGNAKFIKHIFYSLLIKPATQHAYKILTVSHYSKNTICEWAKIEKEKIVVVSNGVSKLFIPQGARHQPGYFYLLQVGNTKPHKNVAGLLQAFALAKINPEIKLILTGDLTVELDKIIKKNQLAERIIISGVLSEAKLAEYYRGALALIFPSLYEGFGLPVVEAMACGTPVLTSNVTALPEIAGDAALLVDPSATEALSQGIEQIVEDSDLRKNLIEKGLQRASLFSWDKTAEKVQQVLNEFK